MRNIIFALLFVASGLVYSNDSLENLLVHANGETRAELLTQLAYTHFDTDNAKGFKSAYEAFAFYKNEHNEQKMAEVMNILGVLHQRSSEFDSALFYYNKATDIYTDADKLAKVFDNMGVIYKKRAQYDSALYFHQNARKLQATIGERAGVAYSLNNIGNVYLIKQDYSKALEYYQKSLAIRKELSISSDIAASYLNIGRVLVKMNKYSQAHQYLQDALHIRQEDGDKAGIAQMYNSIGNFYLQLKIYDKARENYNNALHLHESMKDETGIATALNNIGTVHRELANYDKALEYYQKALDIRKQKGLATAESFSLNNIGGLFWLKKDYAKAISYYEQSLQIRKKMGNHILIAHSLKSIGMVYKDQGLTDKALSYYEQSLDAFMQESDLQNIASIQNSKGNLYRKLRDFDKALEFYTNALEIYKQLDEQEGIAYTMNNIGLTHQERNVPARSIPAFKEAIRCATAISDRNLEKEASLSLSQALKQLGHFEQSLEYFERFAALKDSLLTTASNKRIAEIEFENDLTTKDHEIATKELEIKEQDTKIAQQRMYIYGVLIVTLIIVSFLTIIYKQYTLKIKANIELEKQKAIIAKTNKSLTEANNGLEKAVGELSEANQKIKDSIVYARKIQDAILPQEDLFHSLLPNSFVLYQPRDIVSGDFYWLHKKGAKTFVAVSDCTGHGVPGAFMSMIGHTLLNEIVIGKNITDPAIILAEMDKGVINALKQDMPGNSKQEDGMEMSLCIIDSETNSIEFAGTDQKMFIARNNGIETVSGNIFPIGGMVKLKQRKQIPYSSHRIPIEKGMSIYMLSDGYIDQFGGKENQRFTSNRLIQLLQSLQHLDMQQQYHLFMREFEAWKGNNKQIDDVLVLSIQFS